MTSLYKVQQPPSIRYNGLPLYGATASLYTVQQPPSIRNNGLPLYSTMASLYMVYSTKKTSEKNKQTKQTNSSGSLYLKIVFLPHLDSVRQFSATLALLC